MLYIKLDSDKDKIIDFCHKNRQVYSPAFYIYSAYDGDNIIASGFFKINSDFVSIIDYESTIPNDQYLFDGILRAGFNYANENNIITGVVPESFRAKFNYLFSKINFTNQQTFNINNFFNKFKNCN